MSDFASLKYTAGQLNAVVKLLQKQGGEQGVERFLRGELIVSEPSRKWREENGMIRFAVTSDGTTGEEWIARLEGKGFQVGKYAKQVLRSAELKPTSGVTSKIAVLPGSLFEDSERITRNIRTEADGRKLGKPNPEVACLIREMFSDAEIEAMGLWWIVAMHEPILDSDGDSGLLGVYRSDGGRWLGAGYGRPDDRWNHGGGFAFVCGAHLAPKP